MKKSIIIFLILLLSGACSGSGAKKDYARYFTDERVAILNNADGMFGDLSKSEKEWRPTGEERARCLNAAFYLIESKQKEVSWDDNHDYQQMLEHAPQYYVQIFPVEKEGKRYLLLNFLGDELNGWRERAVEVLDGGEWFWNVRCEIKTYRCDHLWINGYALAPNHSIFRIAEYETCGIVPAS